MLSLCLLGSLGIFALCPCCLPSPSRPVPEEDDGQPCDRLAHVPRAAVLRSLCFSLLVCVPVCVCVPGRQGVPEASGWRWRRRWHASGQQLEVAALPGHETGAALVSQAVSSQQVVGAVEVQPAAAPLPVLQQPHRLRHAAGLRI